MGQRSGLLLLQLRCLYNLEYRACHDEGFFSAVPDCCAVAVWLGCMPLKMSLLFPLCLPTLASYAEEPWFLVTGGFVY